MPTKELSIYRVHFPDNELSRLPINFCKGFVELRICGTSSRMTRLPEKTGIDWSTIHTLEMGYMKINHIPNNFYGTHMYNLKSLELTGENIREIPRNFIINILNSNIRDFNIATNNSIKTIPKPFFSKYNKIRNINIDLKFSELSFKICDTSIDRTRTITLSHGGGDCW